MRIPFAQLRTALGKDSLTGQPCSAVLPSLRHPLALRFVNQWERFVIIHKPAGVSVTEASYCYDSVRVRLLASHPWQAGVWFPHRLDKHARGLMAVAFDRYSCSQLAKSLTAGQWTKRYRVLAAIPPRALRAAFRNPLLSGGSSIRASATAGGSSIGAAATAGGSGMEAAATAGNEAASPLFDPYTGAIRSSGTIMSYIGDRCPDAFPHPSVRASTLKRAVWKEDTALRPRWSITHFRLVEADEAKGLALFDVNIDTGRTHQIRVHFAEAGAPLVNDWYYNPACTGWQPEQVPTQGQLCLHAYRLELPMPLDAPHMPTHLATGDAGGGTRVTRYLRRRRERWHALSHGRTGDGSAPAVEPDYVRLQEDVEDDFRLDSYPAGWWDRVMAPFVLGHGHSGSVTHPHRQVA